MSISTENRTTQLVSVMGLQTCDIVYYITRILNAAGKRVLVADNSEGHELFQCIRKPDNENMVQTGEIYYITNIAYSEEFFAQYDFVIIYHGMQFDKEMNTQSDYRILQSDYKPYTTSQIREQLCEQDENLNYHLLFRDKAFSKISEKMLLTEIGLPEKDVADTYEIPYLEQDYMCYIGLLRNGSVNLKSLSSDMKAYLKEVMMELLTVVKPSHYNQIFKRALSGKIK